MRVPAEYMICEEGRGFIASMRILDMNRPTVGAASVGVAQGALELAVVHAKERKQFGRAIGQFQGLQWMLADMAMQIEAARALVYECATGSMRAISRSSPCSPRWPSASRTTWP